MLDKPPNRIHQYVYYLDRVAPQFQPTTNASQASNNSLTDKPDLSA